MNIIKNIFKPAVRVLAVAAVAAVGAVALLGASKASAQSTVIGGYPVFIGGFIPAGPIGMQAPSNSAPLSRISAPLTSGATFTNPIAQGFITVNVLTTNNAYATLTNLTTGSYVNIGSYGGLLQTNYSTVTVRVGPGDLVQLTNQVGTPVIISSEWRN